MDGMDRADFEEKARWLEEIRAVEAAEQAITEKKVRERSRSSVLQVSQSG